MHARQALKWSEFFWPIIFLLSHSVSICTRPALRPLRSNEDIQHKSSVRRGGAASATFTCCLFTEAVVGVGKRSPSFSQSLSRLSRSLTCSSTESVSSLSLSTTIGPPPPPPLGQTSSDDVVEAAEDDEDEEEEEEGELEAGAAPDADGDQLWQP